HLHPLQRELLAVGVHPQGHRGAGAEGAQQQVVRRRSGVGPADALGLVGEQAVMGRHDLLEEALGRSQDQHLSLAGGFRVLQSLVVHGAGIVAPPRDTLTSVSSEPILEALEVAKTYGGASGTVALAGVTLAVRPGETVALVGESGSGKTTLLRTFNRMIDPSSGTVRIEGKPVAELDPIALRR